MYKTCAFSWEPEVTDAFYTTSCSQHNKSGRSARLKKGKAISFWFCGRKKAYQHFAVFFTWQSTFRGIIKKVSWMPLFHILSYFKNVLIIAVTTLNKPRWNDCILYITSTTFSYSCLWRAFTFHIWDSPSDLTQWGLLRQLYNYSEKKKNHKEFPSLLKAREVFLPLQETDTLVITQIPAVCGWPEWSQWSSLVQNWCKGHEKQAVPSQHSWH